MLVPQLLNMFKMLRRYNYENIINKCKSKKRLSNSGYFTNVFKLFANYNKYNSTTVKLPLTKKYNDIFSLVNQSTTVILAVPVYVDGLPSHVVSFLQELQLYLKENPHQFKLYVIANCGFYEGSQTKHLLAQVKLWCQNNHIEYAGGVGIGAGEMLGFIQYLPIIYLLQSLILFVIEFIKQTMNNSYDIGLLIHSFALIPLAIRLSITLLFSLGMFIALAKLASRVKKERNLIITIVGYVFVQNGYLLFLQLFIHGKLP